jgi:hypothetical protein
MIALLRAFVWLRWRLLVGTLRGGSRRDALERLSRILAALVPALLLAGVVVTALALGGAALGTGWAIGARAIDPAPVLIAVRGVLFVVSILVLMGALSGPGQGALPASSRLLTLPVSTRHLHLAEALTGLLDPWIVYVIPALLLLPLGLLLAGRATSAAAALAGGLAFLGTLAALASAVSQLARWFLRDRRRAETFTLVFVLGISLAGALPALLGDRMEIELRRGHGAEPLDRRLQAGLPRWTRAIPSELYAATVARAAGGSPRRAALPAAALLLQAGLLFALSATAHRRGLASVESGTPRRAGTSASRAAPRLPFLSEPTSAVAWTQARTALRTVRGRLVVLASLPVIVIFGVLARRMPGEIPGGQALGNGDLLLGVGTIFGLYAMQAFTMNQFGTDRSGLTMQFLAPLSDRQLVFGKAVGCGLVFGLSCALSLLCSAAVAPGGSPLTWASVLLGAAATYALLCPVAAALSAMLPVASDLTKTGSGGNPHGLAMAAGTVLVLLLAAPAGAILLVVHHALGRPVLGLLLMAGWTAVAVSLAIPLLALAARVVGPRRENLGLVAGGR